MSRPHPNGPRLYREDTVTASDLRKTKAPKGAVGERQKQAYALHVAGASTKDLAAQYGVSVDTVRTWIQVARQEARGR